MERSDFLQANDDAIDILKRLEAYAQACGETKGEGQLYRVRLRLESLYHELRHATYRSYEKWRQ